VVKMWQMFFFFFEIMTIVFRKHRNIATKYSLLIFIFHILAKFRTKRNTNLIGLKEKHNTQHSIGLPS
jgi:hypothetical protein